jgi:hypothetical protein
MILSRLFLKDQTHFAGNFKVTIQSQEIETQTNGGENYVLLSV